MRVNLTGKEINLPDFFIIGAARSGTTSLYHYLKQHPQIFVPKQKEPRFFSRDSNLQSENVVRKLDDYVDLFKHAKDNQMIGEASTSYLYMYRNVIKSIKSEYGEKYKDIKILAILRNPVERAFSHYLYFARLGYERSSFKEAINPKIIQSRITKRRGYDYIGHGMYSKRIKAYIKEFPYAKIFLYEDFKESRKLIKEVIEFLGIDSTVKIDTNVIVSASGIPKSTKSKILTNLLIKSKFLKYLLPQEKMSNLISFREKLLKSTLEKPEIDLVTREKLINIFRNDILELQKLINRDLSHWLVKKKIA